MNAAAFAGRTALITGASSGIGAALAEEFARQGAAVVLAARRLERLEQLAGRIRAGGGRALAVGCDVRLDADLQRVLGAAHAAGWGIDIVVANAGFGVVGALKNLQVADYQRQFDTNVLGVLRTIQAALPDVLARRGSLVLLGSVAGHVPMAGISPYGMSKFALRALAGALRQELRSSGVAVTLLSPGFVASEFRQIDNAGVHHADAREQIPPWLLVPVERAARVMVSAVRRRRGERVISAHGRVLVWLYRHCPWLVEAALRIWRPRRRSAGR